VSLDLSDPDLERFIRISRTLQCSLPADWLHSVPELTADLQRLFQADFVATSRWDPASGQFRDATCVGRDQAMAADYEREFQFCDPVTPLIRRTGRPTLVREVIEDSVFHRTRFWNEYRLPHNTVDGLDLHVLHHGSEVGDLRLWRGRSSPPFDVRERNLLRILEPGFAAFFMRRQRTQAASIEERFPMLTPREAQVASDLAAGTSDQMIARHLGMSIWTARTHLRHIFAKLDVQNRTALASLLTRAG
jgi:DNA-binding CsgD family transcriptional regulator